MWARAMRHLRVAAATTAAAAGAAAAHLSAGRMAATAAAATPSAGDEASFDKEAAGMEYKRMFTKSYDEVATVVGQRESTESVSKSASATEGRSQENEDEITARLRRSVARVLMERLGYSPEELRVIGNDVDRMQGTGNPFPLANIQPGEIVLDLGSGFGVDAMLAGSKVGEEGRVVGVDLSLGEVGAANQRALSRGLMNVRFYQMDIEHLKGIPDGCIDCVISNGASASYRISVWHLKRSCEF